MTITPHPEPRPPTGALRLACARSTTPPDGTAAYVQATAAHCPYLSPSIARGLTSWTTYTTTPGATTTEIEAAVFAAAVHAAEVVRSLAVRPRGHLTCENIAVLDAGRSAVDWPHWALKHLYAPAGLMVGKFWAGEVDTGRDGRPLPVPPITFLSLRPAVRSRDPGFLDNTPGLAHIVATVHDRGQDVLAPVTGLPTSMATALSSWPTVKAWATEQKDPT
ncbi:DUF6875 domain-containing protein [Kitasatospora sp. NPDC058170]|uniref:DUF6875 domain-containing protein n=1 Tax=Kitasatospora sp. NPDC058170 TaxID=3346364 RepID=UPI0036DDFBDA